MVSDALLKMIKANKNKFARFAGKAYKFKEGRTRVRILPAKSDDLPFHQPIAVHWIKASENDKPIAVVGDVEYTFDGEKGASEITPLIHKAIDSAKAAGNEEDFKLFKSWLPRKGVLVCGLIRDGADASEEPKPIEMTPTLFSDIMGSIELYATDEVPVYALDLKEGFDFIVERKGKGLDTEYSVMKAPSSKAVPAAVMEKLIDLRDYVEKEHFKGEEPKAIAAISRLSGVSASAAIAAPRGTAMLTSRAASLAPAPKAAPAPEPEVLEGEVVEEVVETPKAAPRAAPKAAAAAPKAAPAPAPKADTFGAEVDDADLESMLSELDGLAA